MTKKLAPSLAFLLAALLGVGALAIARSGPRPEEPERWMVALLDGQRVGHAVERTLTDERGNLRTSLELTLKIGRAQDNVEIFMASEFIESPHHEPLEMSTVQRLGAGEVREKWQFIRGVAGSEVMHTREEGERSATQTLPWPEGQWTTPVATRDAIEKALKQGDKAISVRTIDPTSGLGPVEQRFRIEGPAEVEVMGKQVPATRWSATTSALPGVTSTEFVDEQGRSLRTELALGAMKLVLVASEKDVAQSPFDPPEIMARTLVKPTGKPVAHARATASATYRLRVTGDRFLNIPTLGMQSGRVEVDGSTIVSVRSGSASPAGKDAESPEFRGSSSLIDPQDPPVAAMAMDVLSRVRGGPVQRARALRDAVAEHIQDTNLGVGLASASEVARTRKGDCTEHAVLLAALLRAGGFPSRVVSGLVYVDDFAGEQGVFGYHMWTQAIVDEGNGPIWIDLDAAIPSQQVPGEVDATHIALSTSALATGDNMSVAGLAVVLGRLSIEVVDLREVAP